MENRADIIIRSAESADLKQAAEIEAVCFSSPWSDEDLALYLREPDWVLLLAEYDGRIVGELGLQVIVGEGEIANVAVLPEYRGKRIASALMDEVLRIGAEKNITDFTLEVRASNDAAIKLYEKYGFRTEGIRKGFYDKPKENALILWKR